MISKELLSEVLAEKVTDIVNDKTTPKNMFQYEIEKRMLDNSGIAYQEINIYELAHKNLKQWAKLKNTFDIIDWSEEPEQIFKKAEELRNEIN